ncbi:hypothetical protein [Coraliomargarita parva]|uniref:hypothetical protein n=1 Tax=Coraliomargarita parva TaxID=3014050 RepID=UPI0022B51AB4|nr:hypothetical protein [Coraliomargarita parva]
MKTLYILLAASAALFFSACTTTTSTTADDGSAPEQETTMTPEKTSYEGSTGSGLLMERYKDGRIEGYQN